MALPSTVSDRPTTSPRHTAASRGRRRLNDAITPVKKKLALEVGAVTAAVVALELAVFWNYFASRNTPQWDFSSHYTTEAFAWWHDGSFFHPTDWIPYLWGGYPSVVNLQNSSWYLPVGLAAEITTYDQQAAAIVSALHVALGAIGMYLLARQWRMRPSAAMFGLVAWFFAAGFYSNASHVDIMRAYAWVPWVLMCASPQWPWKRWWGPVLATLVFWQAVLGIYPGMLIAAVYAGAAWIVILQVTRRPALRSYLLPLAVSVVLAGAMTMLRFLPAYLTRGTSVQGDGDTSTVTWELLGTFLFPYDDPALPNDITMRSFFLVVPVFAAIAFVRWRAPLARAAAGIAVVAVLLGMPGAPWSDLVLRLPGLDVSRFKMSDFKVFLLVGLCLLAVMGVDRIISDRPFARLRPETGLVASRIVTPRHVYLVVLVAGAATLGITGPFDTAGWLAQWALLCISVALLGLACTALTAVQLRTVVGTIVLTGVMSGLTWVYSVQPPWTTDRLANEHSSFGDEVANLISMRVSNDSLTVRPARVNSMEKVVANTFLNHWGGRSFYDGTHGMTGYANLKSTPTFESILGSVQVTDPTTDAWTFWLAQGVALTSTDGAIPPAGTTTGCAATGDCGLVRTTPVSYSTSPELVYQISSRAPGEISFNEAYYEGWQLTVCDTTDPDRCVDVPVHGGTAGQVVASSLPAGEWQATLAYHLPGKRASWLCFWAGAGALTLWAGGAGLVQARRSRRDGASPVS